MNRRTFNQKQISVIESISAVSKCSEKTISYTKEFKLKALKQYEEGIPPIEIFRQAGFDIQLTGRETPRRSLGRWRETYRTKGTEGILKEQRETRGRPKKIWNTETERIQYLEAQVAYLKAENDFLVKLQAKKSE
jgi:transposase-like protein